MCDKDFFFNSPILFLRTMYDKQGLSYLKVTNAATWHIFILSHSFFQCCLEIILTAVINCNDAEKFGVPFITQSFYVFLEKKNVNNIFFQQI